MVERLCVPCSQVQLARHWNWAASGAAVNASRASNSAATFTPLSTGVSVVVICASLVGAMADPVEISGSPSPRSSTLDRCRVDMSPEFGAVGSFPRMTWAEDDRQFREPAEHEPVTMAPPQLVVGDGEAEAPGTGGAARPSAICPSRRAKGAPRQ